jgi:hypothetical protein
MGFDVRDGLKLLISRVPGKRFFLGDLNQSMKKKGEKIKKEKGKKKKRSLKKRIR